MPWKRYAKKQLKKGGRYAKKRYFRGKGYSNPKISTMAKDVMRLKAMINAEKKNMELSDTAAYVFAQNNSTGTGTRCVDITPVISQGSSEDQRNGDSLKVASFCYQAEVTSNSFNTLQPTRFRIVLFRQSTNPVSTATAITNMYENNQFTGVIDYNSNRNYQNFKDFQILGVHTGIIRSNTNDSSNQIQNAQVKICRKANFHIRYSKGTTTILNNPIYAMYLADAGDFNTSNYISLKHSMKLYFYDN